MKKSFILILCSFIAVNIVAQPDDENVIKPICKIQVTTVNGNVLKGLMLLTYDSVVVIYPGKRKEWNSNKDYQAVIYSYPKIKKIIVKRNGRVMKGIAIGTSIGSLPMFAALNKNEKAGLARFSAITIPAGMLAGAIWGATAQRKFAINACDSLFHEFQNQIQ